MYSGSTHDTLPGAHGMHTRDGSLLKKKQEQWERERGNFSYIFVKF